MKSGQLSQGSTAKKVWEAPLCTEFQSSCLVINIVTPHS